MTFNSYRQLEVWQRSISFVKQVYLVTGSYPKSEMFGLTSQLRRAAVSIPANIAEGRGRSTRKDYAAFVTIARGSAAEIETLLIISRELHFGCPENIDELLHEAERLGKMLSALRNALLSGT